MEPSENIYNKSKIYKVTNNNYTECYIGSTVQPLSSRLAQHRRDYKRYKAGKAIYVSSYLLFDKYGLANCKIKLIEEFPCETKEQLLKREGHHIRQEECINRCLAGRTLQEWRVDHKDQKREYDKRYREEHREGKQAADKAYYQANRENIMMKNKIYSCQKVECPLCQKLISRGGMKRHQTTCAM